MRSRFASGKSTRIPLQRARRRVRSQAVQLCNYICTHWRLFLDTSQPLKEYDPPQVEAAWYDWWVQKVVPRVALLYKKKHAWFLPQFILRCVGLFHGRQQEHQAQVRHCDPSSERHWRSAHWTRSDQLDSRRAYSLVRSRNAGVDWDQKVVCSPRDSFF